ncbi:MAG TPA: SMP-30/gluconolactonase/LRE family protein [Baekduia sp.]|nr:SMP-30/gluconolactonase/LRE family protein [Baekduia sp.]
MRAVQRDGTAATVCEVPGFPSGLGWDTNGQLLVASLTDRRLLRAGPNGLDVVADLSDVTRGAVNDMVVDDRGRAYIGNVGFHFGEEPVRPSNLVLVRPDGSVAPQGDGLLMPNGCVLTPDGRTLIVAETFGGRLTAFDIDTDGGLGAQRVWAQVGQREFSDVDEAHASGQCLPDGLALDEEGAIWVADSNGGPVQRVAPGGKVLDRIDTGDLHAFGVLLGGNDRRTLYLCLSPPFTAGPPAAVRGGRIMACRVDVPGAGRP